MDRDRSGTVGVDRECARGDFLRLCENQHPATGETLTQRLNTLRMDDGKQYRKAVELAAAGKLAESFERLDKMGAVVAWGLGKKGGPVGAEYLAVGGGAECFCRRGVADLG